MTQGFDPRVDHYKVLGVKPDAKADEIKKAYRRLAKKYHPDSTGGDKAKEAKFKEVSTAYDVLGDPDTRAQYDAIRQGPPPGFGGFGGGGGGIGVDLGDLFSQMFTGGGGARQRGGGVHYQVFRGGGADPFSGGGFGESPFESFRARQTTRRPAATKPPAERVIRAKDGSKLTQRGANVYSDVRIGIDQAILGTVAKVPTLTGHVSVKIPPGTSSGVKLRLKGKGPTDKGRSGDHFVTVHIDVPKGRVDEESQKLLAKLMQRLRKEGQS